LQYAEVDLLVEKGGRFIAIEAKFAEIPDRSATKGIIALKNFYGEESLRRGYIASRSSREFALADGIFAIAGSGIDRHLD